MVRATPQFTNLLDYKPGDETALSAQAWFRAASGATLSSAHKAAARGAGIKIDHDHRAPEITMRLPSREYLNTLSDSRGTAGAFARHTGFIEKLELARDAYSTVRRVADVVQEDGDPVWQGVVNTVPTARILPDEANLTQSNPTFNLAQWNLKTFVSEIATPWRWLEDSPAALDWMAALSGEALGTRQNAWYTRSSAGLIAGATAVASAGALITADDLESLIAAVTADGIEGAQFMMSPTAWLAVRKLKDNNSARIYKDGKVADFPVVLNSDLDATAGGSGTVPVLFGNFKRGFRIVDHPFISVKGFLETLIENNQILWYAAQRSDGANVCRGGRPYISKLTMSA